MGLLCHRLQALMFIKLFSVSPSFQPANIPPSGSLNAKHIEDCQQCGIVHRPAENTLHPLARLLMQKLKQYWPQLSAPEKHHPQFGHPLDVSLLTTIL